MHWSSSTSNVVAAAETFVQRCACRLASEAKSFMVWQYILWPAYSGTFLVAFGQYLCLPFVYNGCLSDSYCSIWKSTPRCMVQYLFLLLVQQLYSMTPQILYMGLWSTMKGWVPSIVAAQQSFVHTSCSFTVILADHTRLRTWTQLSLHLARHSIWKLNHYELDKLSHNMHTRKKRVILHFIVTTTTRKNS